MAGLNTRTFDDPLALTSAESESLMECQQDLSFMPAAPMWQQSSHTELVSGLEGHPIDPVRLEFGNCCAPSVASFRWEPPTTKLVQVQQDQQRMAVFLGNFR